MLQEDVETEVHADADMDAEAQSHAIQQEEETNERLPSSTPWWRKRVVDELEHALDVGVGQDGSSPED